MEIAKKNTPNNDEDHGGRGFSLVFRDPHEVCSQAYWM